MKKGIIISTKGGRRIVRGTGYYEPRLVGDLKELLRGSAARFGEAAAFKFKSASGEILTKSYIQLSSDVDSLGTALLALGLKDARISVIGENRYEWGAAFFSIVNGVGIAVPLDKYLPKNEVENLVGRGKVQAVFYSPSFQEMMMEIAVSHPDIQYFICMEELQGKEPEDPRFISMPALIENGRQLIEEGNRSYIDAEIDRYGMSILLFTSGTTSVSKGVMLSHANIAANVTSVSTAIYAGPGDVHLSLLPLHHTFENTVGLMFMVHSGVCIAFCEGIKYIAQNLNEFGVTLLVAVPAIFEVMYRRIQDGINKSGKAGLVAFLIKLSEFLRLLGIDLRRKLFKSIFEKIGPGLRLAVSGAAPLDPRVVTGFDKLGVRLLEGYGLTEAAPVIAANNDFVNVPGTIGFPLGGVEVTIDAPDENGMGELLARGENIMLGYFEDPSSTAETIDAEGWLHTGDLATIDEEGFIRITGRVKSMIVLSNGKKAFPEEFEALLNDIEGIKDSYVWGDRAPDGDIQICAKLVLDRDALLKEDGSLPSEQELAARFDSKVRQINKTLPQYKMIRYFILTYEELIKTTTLKIKRPVEYEKITGLLSRLGLDMRKASGRFVESL